MINELTICGYVGKDPETQSKDGQKKVVKFSVAVTEHGYTSRDGKEIPERTEWFYVVAFDRLGDYADKYVRKGMKVLVKGRVQTRSWNGTDGQKHYTTEVVAEKFELFNAREDGEQQRNGNPNVYGRRTARQTEMPF